MKLYKVKLLTITCENLAQKNIIEILKKHDISLGAAPLRSEQHHALQQALLVEQIAAEKSFLDVLTQEQITALSLRVPVVFDLSFGAGVELSRSRLLSF